MEGGIRKNVTIGVKSRLGFSGALTAQFQNDIILSCCRKMQPTMATRDSLQLPTGILNRHHTFSVRRAADWTL